MIKTIPHPVPSSVVQFLALHYTARVADRIIENYRRYGKMPEIFGPYQPAQDYAAFMFQKAREAALKPSGEISPA